jgi:hypothetical protein
MGGPSDLPPELIALIIDNLHDDRAALRACALVSHAFLPRSQAHIFEHLELVSKWAFSVPGQGDTDTMRTYIPSDPDGVLSYTRNLSIFPGALVWPEHLEDIYGHLLAFKNVEELQVRLFATHFVREGPTLFSRYFSHFQPTLRRLHLQTSLENSKDLITFIASFPLLEEVSIDSLSLPLLPEIKSEGFDPDLLSPLKGSLRLCHLRRGDTFATELAKVRIRYHTLSIHNAMAWMGIQELIIACGPTLRALNIICEDCKLSSLRF